MKKQKNDIVTELTDEEVQAINEQSRRWFDQMSAEIAIRKNRTLDEMWKAINDGGDHFFPSKDELLRDTGWYTKPQSRSELTICMREYGLKLAEFTVVPDIGTVDGITATGLIAFREPIAGVSRVAFAHVNKNTHLAALDDKFHQILVADEFWDERRGDLFFAMSRGLSNTASEFISEQVA